MKRIAKGKRTNLCDLHLVNFEFSVWMRLLCVEDLLYGDGSESVFAICSLYCDSAEDKRKDSMTKSHLSSCALASTLRTSHKATSPCPALSSIRRRRIAATVVCNENFLAAPHATSQIGSPMLYVTWCCA